MYALFLIILIFLVSGSFDKTIKIWDLMIGECIQTISAHSEAIITCNITSDDKWIVSTANDNTLKIFDFSGKLFFDIENIEGKCAIVKMNFIYAFSLPLRLPMITQIVKCD